MIDHLKKEITTLNKRVYDISSSGESNDEFKDLRAKIKEIDLDLYEYIILKAARDKTEINILKSNYLVVLHKLLDIINEMRTTELILEEKIEKLEELVEKKKKIEPGSLIIYGTGLILLLWALHVLNPNAMNAVIDAFKVIGKFFSF